MTDVALGGFFKPYTRKTRAYAKSITLREGFTQDDFDCTESIYATLRKHVWRALCFK